MLKFLKSGSNFKVKVTKFGTNRKVLSLGTHIRNMKALSLAIQKIWPMLKFLQRDKQTDRQTDEQAKNYMPPIFP
jgi:hypothetical protein